MIVIGVLIALVVNEWQKKNGSKSELEEYVVGLKRDLDDDSIRLERCIYTDQLRREIAKDVIRRIRVISAEENPSDSLLIELFNSHVFIHSALTMQDNNTTFNFLVSSGKIDLVKPIELRTKLFEYYKEKKYVRRYEELMFRYYFSKWVDFYLREIPQGHDWDTARGSWRLDTHIYQESLNFFGNEGLDYFKYGIPKIMEETLPNDSITIKEVWSLLFDEKRKRHYMNQVSWVAKCALMEVRLYKSFREKHIELSELLRESYSP